VRDDARGAGRADLDERVRRVVGMTRNPTSLSSSAHAYRVGNVSNVYAFIRVFLGPAETETQRADNRPRVRVSRVGEPRDGVGLEAHVGVDPPEPVGVGLVEDVRGDTVPALRGGPLTVPLRR
jgi:hypothetical protein